MLHAEKGLVRKDNTEPLLYAALSAHLSHRFYLCYTVRGSRSNGFRADSPRCYKRRRIVRADTESSANMLIS
ncbi:hypothetical protein TNCV_3673451 [Trichonephila clavipes]|nr:hypothetical protein TNCV_3673451 [Trichonephila clavipes]